MTTAPPVNRISDLLARGAADAPALRAPDRVPLGYGSLRNLAHRVGRELAALGIKPGDRVAIVLPNGPAMASAFVTVAAYACAAPLNPAYREDEFDFYLSDLRARLLIVAAGVDTPARAVAKRHGIPVIELDEGNDTPAGYFELAPVPDIADSIATPSEPDDEALVLHTSGTTSRPKIVPLSNANVSASARHIATTLELTAADACMNIMPLFHIHGLIAAVLSSLHAGASIYCTPGFNAMKVFGWFADADPTWYTAVPTMHQAILGRASRNRETLGAMRLRFIRSSSSSLPPTVMAELETTFGCPVVESYGMTEASHQMTSNPIAPGTQKAGSVGIAAGPEVRLMTPDGQFVTGDGEGEIVIRGPNVTAGYEANPKANAESFPPDPDGNDGNWFRTGDQGRFDADGYLFITGRIKEIINRGGEKIAPREVDEVLMEHPGVAQAVTFALPHDKLGEDVAAAIVPSDPENPPTVQEIRDFAATKLADFKVPRKVVVLDEIPKGATGKLQRIGLAEKLGRKLINGTDVV